MGALNGEEGSEIMNRSGTIQALAYHASCIGYWWKKERATSLDRLWYPSPKVSIPWHHKQDRRTGANTS